MNDEALHNYLAIGYVVDPTAASDYVRQLLDPAIAATELPVDLLCRIVEDATTKNGHAGIVIPLSGGYDSRGLLGAALQVMPASAIKCITFGPEKSRDMMVATETCARLGLEHERIDSNNDIVWDLERFTSIGVDIWNRWNALAEIDGIAAQGTLAARIGDRLVLSGYIGDAVSGRHLPLHKEDSFGSEATAAFLAWSRASQLSDGIDRDHLRRTFDDFLERHGDLVASFPGLTPFDILDLGFRQRSRIRSGIDGPYKFYISPYEDPRWFAYWMSQKVSDRVQQSAYRQLYRTAFPAVFPDAPASRLTRIKRRIPVGLKRRLRRRIAPAPPAVAQFHERGDPRLNPTMANVLHDLAASFDARRLFPVSVLPAFTNMMGDSPRRADALLVFSAASAEMYLQAGVLAPAR